LSSLPGSVSNEMLISLARINYLAYLQVAHYLKYRPAQHTKYIAKLCEKIEAGELKRVMFFLPPRHSKSMTVTESFPSWFIGKNPDRRVIEVSYGESLARRFGRANRRKVEEFGAALFGIEVAGDNASVTNWSIEGHDGGMISVGVGGPATGAGADCLIAGTMIETEIGMIDIQALYRMIIKPRVLMFCHKTQTLQWGRILASREIIRNGLIEIETARGYKLTATRKHCIYVKERGYRPAHLLQPGNRIIAHKFTSQQVEEDVVVRITELGVPAVPVYDIQVEGECNFFANEILVHNCLIIDDPVKNRQEADSLTYRNMLWDEYRNTLLTRLQPNASIILILTRWHEDDLAGRVLENEGDQWTVVKLPAEAEENDLLGRAPGEMLWPEYGFNHKWAEKTKLTVGSQVWNALYQQRPSPAEGALVKRGWWKYYVVVPGHFDDIILSWDMTFKDEAAAASGNPDYVVGQVWGRVEADKYLLDQVRGKMDFPDTVKAVRALKAKWKESTAILIEDSANGPAIIASLKHEIPGIIPWPAQGSKTERLAAVSSQIEAGNIFIPDPIIAEWIFDYVEEFSVFPNGNNDDQVDSTTQALRYWMRPDKAPASVSTFREITNQ